MLNFSHITVKTAIINKSHQHWGLSGRGRWGRRRWRGQEAQNAALTEGSSGLEGLRTSRPSSPRSNFRSLALGGGGAHTCRCGRCGRGGRSGRSIIVVIFAVRRTALSAAVECGIVMQMLVGDAEVLLGEGSDLCGLERVALMARQLHLVDAGSRQVRHTGHTEQLHQKSLLHHVVVGQQHTVDGSLSVRGLGSVAVGHHALVHLKEIELSEARRHIAEVLAQQRLPADIERPGGRVVVQELGLHGQVSCDCGQE